MIWVILHSKEPFLDLNREISDLCLEHSDTQGSLRDIPLILIHFKAIEKLIFNFKIDLNLSVSMKNLVVTRS